LDQIGIKLPGWQVRQLMEEADRTRGHNKKGSKLSLDDFENVRRTSDPSAIILRLHAQYFIICFIMLILFTRSSVAN